MVWGHGKRPGIIIIRRRSISEQNDDRGIITRFLHGPGHSSEEWKVLRDYSKKYTAQRPHKDNEAHSGIKIKRNKSAEFDSRFKKANVMEHGNTIPKKKKKKN